MENSPPSFITIRTPGRDPEPPDAYGLALQLVEKVHRLVINARARYQLKDWLDRETTALVMRISKANADMKSSQWKHYRAAARILVEISTILDILDRQQTSQHHAIIETRAIVRSLVSVVTPLAALG